MDLKITVLIIDDELPLRRFLRTALSAQEYEILESATGEEGLLMVVQHMPEIVILDLGLPDMDGMDVLKKLREWSSVPVIVLSARNHERSKVNVLDAGADDYLTKPFAVEELLARMRVAIRHSLARANKSQVDFVYEVAGLKIDFVRRLVLLDSERVHVSPIEFKLLSVLAMNAGRIMTHKQLLRDVWGLELDESNEQRHYPRVYMQHLRRKIEKHPAKPRYLLTTVGVGYMLADQ
jgi:two-component system KDP operon response regulator KdpE